MPRAKDVFQSVILGTWQVRQPRNRRTKKNIKMDVKKFLRGRGLISVMIGKKWWAVLKAETVLWVPQNVGNILAGWKALHEGLYCIALWENERLIPVQQALLLNRSIISTNRQAVRKPV